MEDLGAFISRIEAYADRQRLGEAQPDLERCEVSLRLRDARRRGRDTLPAVAALRRALRAEFALAGRRAALTRLARFRILLAAGFALAGRAWLGGGEVLPRTWDDAACLGLAVTVGAGFQAAVRHCLPRGWLWSGGLSPDGLLWLRALLGERVAPAGLVTPLDRLRSDELRRGLSRRDARDALLQDFAGKQAEAFAERLARAEAAWPLAELAGIGIPVLLTLAGRWAS